MQITLPEPLEEFVRQAVSEGRFASESEVVSHAVSLIQERERKLAELRAMITASLAEGGAFTAEEMNADMEAQCQELHAEGIPW